MAGAARQHRDDGDAIDQRRFSVGLVSRRRHGQPCARSHPWGPGVSESALFRHYDAELEQHFLVVNWEQRGTGRSYHANIDPSSMTIAQIDRDLDAVVDHVRRRFGKEKVVLLAHSWGTVPGIVYAARKPEKIAACIGVAQIADVARGLALEHAFDLAEAKRLNDVAALAALHRIGRLPYGVDAMLALGKLTERLSGDISTGRPILAALSTEEASLIDLLRFGQGNRFTLDRLWPELSIVNLADSYRHFDVPIFFFLGRRDWHVASILAAQWLACFTAPIKGLVWFEESAHNPPYQQPEALTRAVVNTVFGGSLGPPPILGLDTIPTSRYDQGKSAGLSVRE